MRLKLIKKIIALTLIFSMTLTIGTGVFSGEIITVQADDDWDDRYYWGNRYYWYDDDWDDDDWYDDDDWDDRYYWDNRYYWYDDDWDDDDWYDDDDWDDRYYWGNRYYWYDDDDWDNRYYWYDNRYVPNVGGNNLTQGGTNNRPAPVKRPANTQAISSYLKTVYKNIFGRGVDQQGLNYWVQNLSSGQVDLKDFFKNLLVENEFLTAAPTAEDKIKKLYAGIFQREPDQGGFNYWVDRYKQKLRNEGNEREALKAVIDDMTDSDEFNQILRRLGLN